MKSTRKKQFRFKVDDPNLSECFTKNGLVIVPGMFPKKLIKKIYKLASSQYFNIKDSFLKNNPGKPFSVLGISNKIVRDIENSPDFCDLIHSKPLLKGLSILLGPDLAKGNVTSLMINDSVDTSKVTNKSMHQEIWTGAGLDDINVWLPLHKPSEQNTLSVIPGSHYYGFLPNQNREVMNIEGFEMPKGLPLTGLEEGDGVMFHSLLLHATAGRSKKQVRFSMNFGVLNLHSPLTSQQKSMGFTPLQVGPMMQIQRILGNEYLSPLRTHGGKLSNADNVS
jgi:hypothetical protein